MTTATIHDSAKAGFSRYYFGRSGHVWETATFPETRRWELLAAQVLNGNITTNQEAHDYFMDGIGTHPVPWSGISTRTKMLWHGVMFEIRRVGDAATIAGKDAA